MKELIYENLVSAPERTQPVSVEIRFLYLR
jgi:hypothetical protein